MQLAHCAVIPLYFKTAGGFGGGSENDNTKNISPMPEIPEQVSKSPPIIPEPLSFMNLCSFVQYYLSESGAIHSGENTSNNAIHLQLRVCDLDLTRE